MKNFTKKIKRKSILVLLSLFTVFFLLSVTFTMSKFVIEKQAGTLTLNVTGADVLLPGLQLRNTLGTSVTEVVFGRTEDYEREIVGIEPKNVDVKKEGKIKLYADGPKAYILSNRKIYANPDSKQMFLYLNNLTAVNFSNFDTGIVTDMREMFRSCTKLTEVKNITSWNTERVKTMRYLFYGCSSLTSLDLSRWNTAKVENLDGVFYNCKGLTSLDVSEWNTENVTTMKSLFSGCSSLTSLDISRWKTAKVKNLDGVFYNCSGLTSLDVSEWNTSAVTDIGAAFHNCKALTSLDVSKWDTENVTIMSSLFHGCSSLTSLDLTGWNTSRVTNMSQMFQNCGGLASIYVGSGWNTDNVYYSSRMFTLCKNLSGGAGTAYDNAHTDKAYARIDGGTANPGYFTDIADKP